MKVEKIDYVWAVLSFILVGVSFHFGWLMYGIIIIFLSLAALMFVHVAITRKQLSDTVAVFGTVTGYHKEKGVAPHYYPMLSYTTEEGREINSVYALADDRERYEVGSKEMICYSPDDPMFFCFADRENDFVSRYYKLMIFGVAGAAVTFIITLIMMA